MTNNDTAIKATPRIARSIPKAGDFAPIDFSKVDKSKNHRRGPRRRTRRRVIL